jgi:hypothetical protein
VPDRIAPQGGPLGVQRPRSVPISPSPLGTVPSARAPPRLGAAEAPCLPLSADGRAPVDVLLAATAAAALAAALAAAAAAVVAAARATAALAAAAAAVVAAALATAAPAAAAAAAAAFLCGGLVVVGANVT